VPQYSETWLAAALIMALGMVKGLQAHGTFCIETVEAFIDGRMSARAGSDDRGRSLGRQVRRVKKVPELAHCLPRSDDGELRNSIKKKNL